MRQVFVFLLLFIVTAATITPCCVYDDCAAEEMLSRTDEKKNTESGCSPFFSCPTCSGFVWMTKAAILENPAEESAQHHAAIYNHHTQQVYSSFWQPPRVV